MKRAWRWINRYVDRKILFPVLAHQAQGAEDFAQALAVHFQTKPAWAHPKEFGKIDHGLYVFAMHYPWRPLEKQAHE